MSLSRKRLEHPHLEAARHGVGIESRGLQVANEFCWSMRAVNLRGTHAFGGFQKLVEVGVIRKRQGVVHAVLVFDAGVHRPTCGDDAHRMLDVGHPVVLHAARECHERVTGLDGSFELADLTEMHAARVIDLADFVDVGVLLHGDAGECEDLRHFLRLAECVAVNDRCAAFVQSSLHEIDKFRDDVGPGRHAILGFTKRAFHHQDVGLGKFGFFASGRGAQFEIAREEEPLFAVVGQQHRRAKAVAGRVGGEREVAKGNRLVVRQVNRATYSEPVLVELGGCFGAERQFMPGDVVGMRM